MSTFRNGNSPTRSDLVLVEERSWREQLVKLCAQLLRRTESELRKEYDMEPRVPNNAFAIHGVESTPRDYPDFVIMLTLQSKHIILKKNSCSWLFNLMDRTGAGYVLRDEFVRYSPYMSPASDKALCSDIFDKLVAAQEKNEAENIQSSSTDDANTNEVLERDEDEPFRNIINHIIKRRKSLETLLPSAAYIFNTETTADGGESEIFKDLKPPERPLNLFPASVALRYSTWKTYYEKVLDKYNADDADWSRVKSELGIDSSEVLIQSEGAFVHADFPIAIGKLFLSQRYLVFFASVGRNHYVIRLGAVVSINRNSYPFREVIEVYLASELQAAKDGVTTGSSKDKETVRDSLPWHVDGLMKKFISGSKPLAFSFLEITKSSKRDSWFLDIKEVIEAYKLHNVMGFGNYGRCSPLLSRRMRENNPAQHDSRKDSELLRYSPFENEPMAPLLVVAAHANISRHKVIHEMEFEISPTSFLIFSHPQSNNNREKRKWYVESVRRHDTWNQKSWIERFLSSVQNNMEANERLYKASDVKPFDVKEFSASVGRLAELCSPVVRFTQHCNQIFQWRNPYATLLAIIACFYVIRRGMISYVPTFIIIAAILVILEVKLNLFGLRIYQHSEEETEKEQKNVFQMVAQVHDALQAAQNVISSTNKFLGKIQTVCLWKSNSRQSWLAILILVAIGLVLAFVQIRILFVVFICFMFVKHFLPPSNPLLRYWESIPSDMNAY